MLMTSLIILGRTLLIGLSLNFFSLLGKCDFAPTSNVLQVQAKYLSRPSPLLNICCTDPT